MKAFVTGSTGLLGNNLVRGLIEAGYEVKALARSQEKANRLLGDTSAQIIVGDMEDVSAFADELAGVDVVFHTAAYFREYYGDGDHWPKLEKINVQGTMDLVRAAEAHAVSTFIHTSSSGVIDTKPGESADENAPFNQFAETNTYFKSKVLTEQRIAEWLEEDPAMKLVMILPGWMFGPWDAAPTAAGRIVVDFMNGDLPGIVSGGNPLTDARDVANAMIQAVEKGRNGERYIISGQHIDLIDIATHLERITGVKKPALRIPYPVALAMAYVFEFVARLTGGTTLMTVSGIRTLGTPESFSSAKAIRELSASLRPVGETLHDTALWYVNHGYIKTDVVENSKLTLDTVVS